MNKVASLRFALIFSGLLSGLLAACGGGSSSASTGSSSGSGPTYDWTAVGSALDSYLSNANNPPSGKVSGYSFVLYNKTGVLFQRAGGDHTIATADILASASKMPAAAAILTLVDKGKLNLDTPIGNYLNTSATITWPGDKSAITMRMLLDHTSGLPGLAPSDNQPNCLNNPTSTTLQACAQQIANADLANPPPGSTFDYGGVDYQVAGYVATVISGAANWQAFFNSAIVTPLALGTFTYGDPNTVTNPRIAADGFTDAADYATILAMLQNGGKAGNGTQVLSASSVKILETSQVELSPNPSKTIDFEPFTVSDSNDFTDYTLGLWISASSQYPGSPGPEFSDPGALGTTPWIDNGLDYGAVILINQDTATGIQMWQQVRPLIISQLTGK
jgi:CubicO group peptidase (beta-lactamase class C family)